jgi:hypothetical protein
MARSSFDRRHLSRSTIDLFLECPRCLYEDVVRRIARPSGPAFTLNIAVDALFKREFDSNRTRQQSHPLFATVGLDAVPLADARMDAWCTNFTGVRWLDDVTGWTLCGAVDDVWLGADGRVMVTARGSSTPTASSRQTVSMTCCASAPGSCPTTATARGCSMHSARRSAS